jgi:EpsD family peptidyl-prolyl cis-trans isomerase
MNHAPPLAAVLLAAAIAAGCGSGEDPPVSQVAARVNAEEISVRAVDAALARSPNGRAQLTARAKREIVDKLIEQQLARQRAIEQKLDRAPQVVQAVEAARSEILARAYFEQIAEAQASPAPEEVRKYYLAHPELFAQRRLYTLEEIAIAGKPDIAVALQERVAKGESMQQIVDWLKAREVRHAVNRGARAAEQIPLEMLPRLQAMKDGEMQLIESGGDGAVVIRVAATQAAPIDEASAAPLIREFLLKRRSGDAVAAEMKRLKAQAKIEYMGEFAGREVK